jgi:hypothetical protein
MPRVRGVRLIAAAALVAVVTIPWQASARPEWVYGYVSSSDGVLKIAAENVQARNLGFAWFNEKRLTIECLHTTGGPGVFIAPFLPGASVITYAWMRGKLSNGHRLWFSMTSQAGATGLRLAVNTSSYPGGPPCGAAPTAAHPVRVAIGFLLTGPPSVGVGY